MDRYFHYMGYQPHVGQAAVHDCTGRHRVVVAGRRSGKTTLAAREIELMLLQAEKKVWIVAPTLDLTERVFSMVWRTLVEDPTTRVPLRRKLWSNQDHLIQLTNGSFVRAKTTRTPQSLIGEGLDLVVYDEAAKDDSLIWDRYLRPALSDRMGRSLITTTPEGHNWVYDLWMRGLAPSREWTSFRFPTSANPLVSPTEIEQARLELSPAAFRQEYEADFASFAGRVYDTFDEAVHVRSTAYDPALQLVRGIDFGYRNPFVCLWLQVDGEDRVRVIDELYLTLHTSAQAGAAVLARERQRGYKSPDVTWADPSCPEGRAVLRGLGIRTFACARPVAQGVEAVRSALQVRADGLPGLSVGPELTKTIREFNLYRVAKRLEPGAPAGAAADEPLKVDDHCMDALRYAVCGVLPPRAPRPIPLHALTIAKPRGW